MNTMSNRTQNHVPAVDTTSTGHLPYAVQTAEPNRTRAEQPATDGAREHNAADLKPVIVMLRAGELDDGNPGILRVIWSYLKGGQWDIEAAYDDQWITRTGAEFRLSAQLAEHGMRVAAFLSENDEYLPKLIAECERRGLALQLTDDPVSDLSEIRDINGRATFIARSNELGVALDELSAAAHEYERSRYAAAGLYIATLGYNEALAKPNPSVTLDNMCDGLGEAMAEIMASVGKAFKVTSAHMEFAETLRTAIADRLAAFTAIEFARSECGDGYGYVFDILADGVRNGGDPHIARTTALDVPKRIRENAEVAR